MMRGVAHSTKGGLEVRLGGHQSNVVWCHRISGNGDPQPEVRSEIGMMSPEFWMLFGS